MDDKIYLLAQDLLNDSFELGLRIYKSGFRPNFIIGVPTLYEALNRNPLFRKTDLGCIKASESLCEVAAAGCPPGAESKAVWTTRRLVPARARR